MFSGTKVTNPIVSIFADLGIENSARAKIRIGVATA
jgi:hypothetical protein